MIFCGLRDRHAATTAAAPAAKEATEEAAAKQRAEQEAARQAQPAPVQQAAAPVVDGDQFGDVYLDALLLGCLDDQTLILADEFDV